MSRAPDRREYRTALRSICGFPIRTLAPVEIFASKIVALSGRAAARDLYDLNNMIYFGLFDEADLTLLRKCAVLYFAIAGDTTVQRFSIGHYEPQLLFEDKDAVDRIANHPMAAWRIGRINEKREIR